MIQAPNISTISDIIVLFTEIFNYDFIMQFQLKNFMPIHATKMHECALEKKGVKTSVEVIPNKYFLRYILKTPLKNYLKLKNEKQVFKLLQPEKKGIISSINQKISDVADFFKSCDFDRLFEIFKNAINFGKIFAIVLFLVGRNVQGYPGIILHISGFLILLYFFKSRGMAESKIKNIFKIGKKQNVPNYYTLSALDLMIETEKFFELSKKSKNFKILPAKSDNYQVIDGVDSSNSVCKMHSLFWFNFMIWIFFIGIFTLVVEQDIAAAIRIANNYDEYTRIGATMQEHEYSEIMVWQFLNGYPYLSNKVKNLKDTFTTRLEWLLNLNDFDFNYLLHVIEYGENSLFGQAITDLQNSGMSILIVTQPTLFRILNVINLILNSSFLTPVIFAKISEIMTRLIKLHVVLNESSLEISYFGSLYIKYSQHLLNAISLRTKKGVSVKLSPFEYNKAKKSIFYKNGFFGVQIFKNAQYVIFKIFELLNWILTPKNNAYFLIFILVLAMPISCIRPPNRNIANHVMGMWNIPTSISKNGYNFQLTTFFMLVYILFALKYLKNTTKTVNILKPKFNTGFSDHEKKVELIKGLKKGELIKILSGFPDDMVKICAYYRYFNLSSNLKRAKYFEEFSNYKYIGRPTRLPNQADFEIRYLNRLCLEGLNSFKNIKIKNNLLKNIVRFTGFIRDNELYNPKKIIKKFNKFLVESEKRIQKISNIDIYLTHFDKLAPITILRLGLADISQFSIGYTIPKNFLVPGLNIQKQLKKLGANKATRLAKTNLNNPYGQIHNLKTERPLFLNRVLARVEDSKVFTANLRQNQGLNYYSAVASKKYLFSKNTIYLPGERPDWVAYVNSNTRGHYQKKNIFSAIYGDLLNASTVLSVFKLPRKELVENVILKKKQFFENFKFTGYQQNTPDNFRGTIKKIINSGDPIIEIIKLLRYGKNILNHKKIYYLNKILANAHMKSQKLLATELNYLLALKPIGEYNQNSNLNKLGDNILLHIFNISNSMIHSILPLKIAKIEKVYSLYAGAISKPLAGIMDLVDSKFKTEKDMSPISLKISKNNPESEHFVLHQIPKYQFNIKISDCLILLVFWGGFLQIYSKYYNSKNLNFILYNKELRTIISSCVSAARLLIGTGFLNLKHLKTLKYISPTACFIEFFNMSPYWLNIESFAVMLIKIFFGVNMNKNMDLVFLVYYWFGPSTPLNFIYSTVYHFANNALKINKIIKAEYNSNYNYIATQFIKQFRGPKVNSSPIILLLYTINLLFTHRQSAMKNTVDEHGIFFGLLLRLHGFMTGNPANMVDYVKFMVRDFSQRPGIQFQRTNLWWPSLTGQNIFHNHHEKILGIAGLGLISFATTGIFELLYLLLSKYDRNAVFTSYTQCNRNSMRVMIRQMSVVLGIFYFLFLISLLMPVRGKIFLKFILSALFGNMLGMLISFGVLVLCPAPAIVDYGLLCCKLISVAIIYHAISKGFSDEYMLILPFITHKPKLITLIAGKYCIIKIFKYAHAIMGQPGINYAILNETCRFFNGSDTSGYSNLVYDLVSVTAALKFSKIRGTNIQSFLKVPILFLLLRTYMCSYDPQSLLGYRLAGCKFENTKFKKLWVSNFKNVFVDMDMTQFLISPTNPLAIWVLLKIFCDVFGIGFPDISEILDAYQNYLNRDLMYAKKSSNKISTRFVTLKPIVRTWQKAAIDRFKTIKLVKKTNLFDFNEDLKIRILDFILGIFNMFYRFGSIFNVVFRILQYLINIFEFLLKFSFFDLPDTKIKMSNISNLKFLIFLWFTTNIAISETTLLDVASIKKSFFYDRVSGFKTVPCSKDLKNLIATNIVLSINTQKKSKNLTHTPGALMEVPQIFNPLNSKINSDQIAYFFLTLGGLNENTTVKLTSLDQLFGLNKRKIPLKNQYVLRHIISKTMLLQVWGAIFFGLFNIEFYQGHKFIFSTSIMLICFRACLKLRENWP